MKKNINQKWIWLLAVALILCIIPAAYVLAKTVEAQAAETVFFYVTNADDKDILVRAAPIDEIRALSHPMPGGQNYAVSSIDSLPTTCYAEAQGFTTDELIDYLNNYLVTSGLEMEELTYQGQDRMYFMADDSFGTWTRSYTADKLTGVERKYVEGLYEGWELFFDEGTWLEDFDLEYEDTLAYKEQAWSAGEVMPVILSPLSNSGRTTTNVSETSEGILEYVIANNGQVRGCLRNYLDTDKALTLYIPTSEDQFMKGMRTCSENFKWIYAIKLKMADPPAVQSEGTVPAAVPSYELIESGGETWLKVTLTCDMPGATIYYNDGQGIGSSAQTRYEEPFMIDVTGIDLSTKPIKYYTRTVCEGYDDEGPQTMQYYQVAPTFQSVSAGSQLGEDVVFEAQTKVTLEEWSAWTGQITKVTLGYPDKTSRDLTANEYSINNESKTITLTKDLFNTTGSHSLTFEAAGYATCKTTRTMKGTAPEITMAAGYSMYEDIVFTFEDSTQAYQAGITAKINGKNVSATYLERTEPGQLTIKASYFATGVLSEPGEYTLELINNNYLPNNKVYTLTITSGLAGEEPARQDGVYLLADADDLFWFAKQVNVKGIKDIKARLTGDIDLHSAPWMPVGIDSTIVYSGIFDGNGYQISGLNVNSEDNCQGLFGYIEDATIKNLTVSGQVKGGGWVGGFAGQAMNSTIENCVNKATVQGTEVNTGGIAGFASGAGAFRGCSNKGSVSGTQSVGGICGQTASTTFVRNCINHGWIYGCEKVGGITGDNAGTRDRLSIDQCVNTGEVSAKENNVGGISGYVQIPVRNCYNTGTVFGEKNDNSTGIGGIAGYVKDSQVIKCYNVGPVSCSPDNAEPPTTPAGAVAGIWASDLSSAGNYYLQNDDLSGIGKCTGTAPDATESKTDDQMKALAPELGYYYAADIDQINSGYPVLKWQLMSPVEDPVPSTYKVSCTVPGVVYESKEATIEVTFAADVVGDIGYDAVRFYFGAISRPEGSKVTFKATDTANKEYTFTNDGAWGPEEGFAIPADYKATTNWKVTFNKAGQYTINFMLKNLENDRVITYATQTVTVVQSSSLPEPPAIIPNPGYPLVRVAGTNRIQTAVISSKNLFPKQGSAYAVVLARADDYPDALAGVSLAYNLSAPLLLTYTDSLPSETLDEINRVLSKNSTVYILGGEKAVSAAVAGELEKNYRVERLAGADRYQTAVKIANALEASPTDVFIVTGENFADAVSVSSIAARLKAPVLLTASKSLNSSVGSYLSANNSINNIYVIGGTEAISDQVYRSAGGTERLGGANRWETSSTVAGRFFSHPAMVAVTTGWNFPDALSGGVLAAAADAPVLLTPGNDLAEPVKNYLNENKNYLIQTIVFGGQNAVSGQVYDKLSQICK